MTNKEIYTKTLTFSLHRVLFEVLAWLALVALTVGGFLLLDKIGDKGLIGLLIGLVLGIVVVVVATRFISYTYKAGQIAMMTRAVTEDSLPEDVLGEGKAIVKERFATVALYFAATRIISGIFRQLGRGLTALGKSVGGDTGNQVASAIDTAIQVVVNYLCDCCLGWIFFRKDQTAVKATCEGAVLFFKHGKTLAKNLGRVFGMGLASLAIIGGVFFGIFYVIFSAMPQIFTALAAEFGELAVEEGGSATVEALKDPRTLMLICAGLAGLILWNILHSVFVRPFVLVGVLRNYMASGVNDIPTEASFALLDSKSDKFRKLRAQGV